MKKYLKFGKILENGKSINFLAMSNSQNENFTYNCEILGYNVAVKELPELVFEN